MSEQFRYFDFKTGEETPEGMILNFAFGLMDTDPQFMMEDPTDLERLGDMYYEVHTSAMNFDSGQLEI